VQAALRGQASSVELEVGSRHRRQLIGRVVPLPQRAGAVVVLHDVTERKQADQVRRDFVANASHELRTPLTAIRGFAETLRDGAFEDPAVSRRFLDTILDHTRRLERLTQDLLELSRLESKSDRLPLQPVDMRAVAGRVVQGLAVAASERQVDLAMEPALHDAIANADERALDQVLVNLVDNAVKYTPEGGKVWVRIVPDTEWAAIEVGDTGPGIAAHHLPRIFERFYRIDAGRAREVGGTGLGLAIVKHLVQRMGGQVSVESTVGKGTTFRVKLRAHEVRD
jgi:two-component system phosphate regulon sensor histidine kinase PhoR